MPVHEQLMKVGSFSVALDDPPISVRRQVAGFKSVVITGARLSDRSMTRAALLAAARYRGVVFGWERDRAVIRGAGMLSYLGDAGKIGQGIRLTLPHGAARTFEQWWDYWQTTISRTNGLTKGSTYSMPATTWSVDSQLHYNARRTFEALAQALLVEYRANPDGTVDMGGIGSALFRTSPEVLLARGVTSTDFGVKCFPITSWNVGKDYEDYTNFVRAENPQNRPLGDAASNLEPIKDAGGSNALMRARLHEDDNIEDTTTAANIAQGVLDQHEDVRVDLSVSIDVADPRRHLCPGDHLWVYDLVDQLWNTSNQVTFQGRAIHPAKLRLRGMRWPIKRGMGVYLMSDDSTEGWVDLTDWVAWESGSTALEVGAPGRSAFDD